MKLKIQYTIILIVVIILSIAIPNILTSSRYYSNIEIESEVPIAQMIFEINRVEQEQSCNIAKGSQTTVKYKLSNKDEKGNINQLDLKYSIKVVDENDTENLQLEIKVEENNGTLKYDGTEETKEININIKCPENYSGENILKYKVKIKAENITNEKITEEKTADLIINIKDTESTENNESQEGNGSHTNNEVTEGSQTNVSNEENGTSQKNENNVISEGNGNNESSGENTTNNGSQGQSYENNNNPQNSEGNNSSIQNNEITNNQESDKNANQPITGTQENADHNLPTEGR